ncbi:hypothetical protein [Anaeromicrobium sediminis]|uniref:Uncharacterized protein n=1 Tax=Anaeromicrobium sediminis TaxID=1478221 RepID=A0A267MG21_9FIRM|nr:hypothetical protein [Anaeromicrobium sediminis]PAB57858.1 hypothetical protein CCE28_17825 [Anaeromicrobium sediminis]
MDNNKIKNDTTVNVVQLENNINITSKNVAAGTKGAYCTFEGSQYGVGSTLEKPDGTRLVCTEDGSWQYS